MRGFSVFRLGAALALAVAPGFGAGAEELTLDWAGGLVGTGLVQLRDSAVDAQGSVYVTGRFTGTADFDPGPDTFDLISAGNPDIFIAKLSSSGALVWAKQIGNSETDDSYGITVDADGNAHITGHFYGTVDFDPGPGVFNLVTAADSVHAFACKLDANGDLIWAKIAARGESCYGREINVDGVGNVLVAGYFINTADFDPGSASFQLTSSLSSVDAFLSKLDANGDFVWARRMGGTDQDFLHRIAVDASGNLYAAGDTDSATAEFGSFNLTGADENDAFLCKLDPDGTFLWAKRIGGTGSETAQSIALGPQGEVYATGTFEGTVDFDPGAGTASLSSAGIRDVFVLRLDNEGAYVWARHMGGTDDDFGLAIAVDALGNAYTTGNFSGNADFDPGAPFFNLSALSSDAFVSKLYSNGNFAWAGRMGGNGGDSGNGIGLDAAGKVYVAGRFRGTADFDTSEGVVNLTGSGISDNGFVTAFNTPDSAPAVCSEPLRALNAGFEEGLEFEPPPGWVVESEYYDVTTLAMGLFGSAPISGGQSLYILATPADAGAPDAVIRQEFDVPPIGEFSFSYKARVTQTSGPLGQTVLVTSVNGNPIRTDFLFSGQPVLTIDGTFDVYGAAAEGEREGDSGTVVFEISYSSIPAQVGSYWETALDDFEFSTTCPPDTEPDLTNAVYGIVRESATGLPVPGVAVALTAQTGGFTNSTTTNNEGFYAVDGPEGGGPVNMGFSKSGFLPRSAAGISAPRELDINFTSIFPATPTDLTVRPGAGSNTLRWNPNTETDLAGYNLYVSVQGGPYELLNTTPITDTEFVHDGLVTGSQYRYQVTAVDTDGNESPASDSVLVEAGRIEVFVPRVSGPVGTEVRIPINVDNAAGISPQGIDIDFRYPAAFLGGAGVDGIRLERTALTRNVTPQVNATEPGRVRITSAGATASLVGEGHIFNIYLTLADDVAGQCSLLELANVKFYDDSVPAQPLSVDFSLAGDLCGEQLCVQGDLNGDNDVDSADVLAALQISVELLEASPCRIQAGDLNGDLEINSADAIMIQRLAVGFPINPPQPGEKAVPERRAPKGSTLTVSAGNIVGAPGGLVQVPVRVLNADGLSGLNLTLAFPDNDTLLTLESVENGPLLDGFSRIENIGPGFVKLGFSKALPIATGGGIAALLNFRLAESAVEGASIPIALNEARVNGQFGDSFAWTQVIERGSGSIAVSADSGAPALLVIGQFPVLDAGKDDTLSRDEAAFAGIGAAAFSDWDANENGLLEMHELIEAAGPGAPVHRADRNGNGSLDIGELLRVIQLYNAGGYDCDPAGEDGYAPGSGDGAPVGCLPHSADYLNGPDGAVNLSEVLRQVQIYAIGGYAYCPEGPEDGFCPQD